jgi:rhodanese-related sulfurtransferase
MRELQALNTQISVSSIQARLSPDTIGSLITDVDLVIDAADNFATTFLLSDACHMRRLPLVSASVNRSFGFVGVFCGVGLRSSDKPIPSFRALFPKLPQEQLSCDTVGVTGPSVGLIASVQAQETIKVLINDPHALFGKILYADLWQYKMHYIDFSNAKEPTDSQIEIISQACLNNTDTILDVRNPEEIETLPHTFTTTLAIPMHELDQRLKEIPNAQRVVCVCASGQRAIIAAQQILDYGHSHVAVMLPSR